MVTVLPAKLAARSYAAAGEPTNMSIVTRTQLGRRSLYIVFSGKRRCLTPADRRFDLGQQTLGDNAITYACKMLAIRLQVLRQAGEDALRHDHLNAARLQAADDCADIAGALAADSLPSVIIAGLQDHKLRSRWHRGVQAPQHSSR